MPTERPQDPELLQALAEAKARVQEERAAQDGLARERARLQARVKALEAQRNRLHREMGYPGRTPPRRVPRLPARLEPPFTVHMASRRRVALTEAFPWGVATGFIFSAFDVLWAGALTLVMGVALGVREWNRSSYWKFTETRLEEHPDYLDAVRYVDVREARVHATVAQRRHGIGDVVVKHGTASDPRELTLWDVPEPERLAEWLRSKREPSPRVRPGG
jgi:hypothetical protein